MQLQFVRVSMRLRFELTHFQKRFRLYHLDHEELGTSKNSVCLIRHEWDELKFIYAADIHVAEMWNELQSRIVEQPRRAPMPVDGRCGVDRLLARESLQDNFVDANRNFVNLIEEANRRADEDNLDLLVIGGDLVDYVYCRPRKDGGDSYQDTNVALFEKLLLGECGNDALRVPLIATAGNHDYRLYPYRLGMYGLRHCGFHNRITQGFLGLRHPVGRAVPNREDMDSIWGRTGQSTSLDYYLTHINPELDFVREFGDLRFACFDTGRDAFLNTIKTHPRRWKNLVRTVLFGGSDPDSEALSDAQAELLKQFCGPQWSGAVIAVLHAGLFNSLPGFDVRAEAFTENGDAEWLCDDREYQLPLSIATATELGDSVADNVEFETKIRNAGLNNGCLFSNQASVASVALVDGRPFLALGGHAHREFEVRVDRDTGQLFNRQYSDSEILCSADGDSYVLTPMALGTVQSKYPVPDFPAFYVCRHDASGDLHLRKHLLCAPPLDSVWFYVRETGGGGGGEGTTLELLFGLHREMQSKADLRVRVVFLAFGDAGPKNGAGAFQVTPESHARVDKTWHEQLSDKDLLMLGARSGQAEIFDCGFFEAATFRIGTAGVGFTEVMIWAEVYFVTASGPESVRLCVHPRSFALSS